MSLNLTKTKKNETSKPPCNQDKSPYLPPPRGAFKEKLSRIRFKAVYWIWKRSIRKYTTLPEQDLNFLEVGCGAGNFVYCLEDWFPKMQITALDVDCDLLKYSASRTNSVTFLQTKAETLDFPERSFNVVSALQVVEHLDDPEKFFSNVNKVLKENGLLLLSTPNTRGLAARLFKDCWQGIRDDHISLNPPHIWREMFKANGFKLLSEGTTLFNGIPLMRRFPFNLPFVLLQTIFGWFPWKLGESYMALLKKNA